MEKEVKLRFLVTGLCLQGNKGGPAIALSLRKQIEKLMPGSEFTLSVPAGKTFPREVHWSKTYGFEVVEDFSYYDLPYLPLLFHSRARRVGRWLRALRASDVVIEMSAISYFGPPVGTAWHAFYKRFRYYLLARLFRRPMLAWTQSYGPLNTRMIRAMARIDLRCQPVIFCRGDDCRVAVKELLPDKEARSFPDVAVALDYDTADGTQLIQQLITVAPADVAPADKLITISPSAVIYRAMNSESAENRHVQQLVALCDELCGRGFVVLLVPHTKRISNSNPLTCDCAVAELIMAQVKRSDRVALAGEDLSPTRLKSIISAAWIHIGGRYHSIVAALSAGVPCLSLSWHGKYRDMMRMYGVEQFVHESIDDDDPAELLRRVDDLLEHRDQTRQSLRERHGSVVEQVEENTRQFVELIKEAVS